MTVKELLHRHDESRLSCRSSCIELRVTTLRDYSGLAKVDRESFGMLLVSKKIPYFTLSGVKLLFEVRKDEMLSLLSEHESISAGLDVPDGPDPLEEIDALPTPKGDTSSPFPHFGHQSINFWRHIINNKCRKAAQRHVAVHLYRG